MTARLRRVLIKRTNDKNTENPAYMKFIVPYPFFGPD